MQDNYGAGADSVISSALRSFAITPHDTNKLPLLPKAIYVGTAGDVTLRPRDAEADIIYKNVPAGAYLMVRASHVRATGTTAADLIAEA